MATVVVAERGPVETLAPAARVVNLLSRHCSVPAPERAPGREPDRHVSVPLILALCNVVLILHHSTAGALAIYLIGAAGIRGFKFPDPQDTRLFKTASFILVCTSFATFCALER